MDMQNVAKLEIPEGEVRTIHDKDGNLIWGKVSYGVKYKGDTAQNGTPTPSAPVAVQTVTGENVVKISDGQGAEQSLSIDLGSIELCKIGTYQDYIYKSGDKWYMHKAVGKYVYNNDLGENGISSSNVSMLTPALNVAPSIAADAGTFYSNMLTATVINDTGIRGTTSASKIRVQMATSFADSYAGFRTLAAANNLTVWYPFATPTDTEITNETLVGQLEAVGQWLTRYGYNATVSGNLPIIIDRTAL